MKYIRTKDGVYKVNSYIEQNGKIVEIQTAKFIDNNDKTTTINMKNFYKAEIISQADTIEELCDEFRELLPKYKGNDIIGYEPEKWEYSVSDKKFYNDIGEWCYVEDFIIRDYTVYGAIWTSKGLIYVAKMNEKGELELI